MKMKASVLVILAALLLAACQGGDEQNLLSPDGNIELSFSLGDGKPYYSVSYLGEKVIEASALGMVLQDGDTLSKDLTLISTETSAVDDTWEQPWGASQFVRNHHNELILHLQQGNGREFDVIFRVFDDGLGFRYVVPEQEGLDEFVIMDELTEFAMAGDHRAWWIPAYAFERYEYWFENTPISEMDTVHTPLTMVAASSASSEEGLHISIHEAALTEYSSMTLASLEGNVLKCDLAPWSDGTKVKTAAPMQTPWRTIMISPDAGGLVTSNLILNLNEPNRMEDLSWVKPTKYLGIWWGMHINKYTFWQGPDHGATTERSMAYIDYCTLLGIDHLLIEGWNTGWYMDWFMGKKHDFSFTESTPDFDFKKVSDYAREKGVHLIGYHETGADVDNYFPQIDAGMQMYADAGMHAIKIGQVGPRLGFTEWHYGQYGVAYYDKVLAKAAQYKLSVNFHEPLKQTGRHRTFPHWVAAEGARGQEYNAWSAGNPPEHTVILPFNRFLGGPMDFTPGVFGIRGTRVHTTLAKQLALYVTIYSPIQMLCDLPENYVGHPAFQFLADVPVEWYETRVLNARIGDYFTVVRKDKYSDDWYLGSITGEEMREFTFTLDFLEEGRTYEAQIYADAADAEYDVNPEAYKITSQEVEKSSEITIRLAKSGGQAIRFKAL